MKILLVDDEELQLLRLEKAVKEAVKDAEILSFSNPLEAFDRCRDEALDLAFLDIEMPGINGIQLAKRLKKARPSINIIFVTAYPQYALEAFSLHASGYLTKPVSKQKVIEELNHLREPVQLPNKKSLQVKCFGNFEVFKDGKPLRFSYKKSKELFAYLIDREGSVIHINELNAVLWEEDHPSYLRNLIVDIQSTLRDAGADDVFIRRHSECSIDPERVDCDAYEYKKGNPEAIRAYRGEYMMQYSWPIFDEGNR